ncbi:hypothetical protein BU25DRAFT_418567 [Macroventuria anomochaeta]|uniref:Uncharacterized protein n=1 Tax=Macroventuria anomochaeta TaxID=301207 RepID=A0ACB6SEY2_9PLEO|nr:uncharacterized protein BU25DRAFT_418567 [Macroventuria anomochaeta]KAF2631824.1 hypothetical protein BU25DRAFT_418567 [Macroventuria anomochaeta]
MPQHDARLDDRVWGLHQLAPRSDHVSGSDQDFWQGVKWGKETADKLGRYNTRPGINATQTTAFRFLFAFTVTSGPEARLPPPSPSAYEGCASDRQNPSPPHHRTHLPPSQHVGARLHLDAMGCPRQRLALDTERS